MGMCSASLLPTILAHWLPLAHHTHTRADRTNLDGGDHRPAEGRWRRAWHQVGSQCSAQCRRGRPEPATKCCPAAAAASMPLSRNFVLDLTALSKPSAECASRTSPSGPPTRPRSKRRLQLLEAGTSLAPCLKPLWTTPTQSSSREQVKFLGCSEKADSTARL